MAPHEKLLAEYQQVLVLSEQMLVLATEEKWDELVNMEITYINAIENTIRHSMPSFSTTQQEKLKKILSAILKNECEIKRLLQLRMMAVSKQLMGQINHQQAVNAAYGQSAEYLLLGDNQ